MINKELIRKAAEDIDIFEADLTEEYNRLCASRHHHVPMWPIWTAACVVGILLLFFIAPREESSLPQSAMVVGTDSIPRNIPMNLPNRDSQPVIAQQESSSHRKKHKHKHKQADVPGTEESTTRSLEAEHYEEHEFHEIIQKQNELLLAMEQDISQHDLREEIRMRGNRMHEEFINMLEE